MDKDAALQPMDIRFTAPEDVEKYGQGWFGPYDELNLIMTPARKLIEIESELGTPLAVVMRGVRRGSALGELGAAWLALRAAGKTVAFDDFDPLIKLIEWRTHEEADPKEQESPPNSAGEDSGANSEMSTGQADIVVLPIMEASASPT